jgi:hypothetical protein
MNPQNINFVESGGKIMPLDEKEKKALKEKYKEHRQAIWLGKSKAKGAGERSEHSRKLNEKKEEEINTSSSAEQPTKSANLEDAISVEESSKLADYEEQNQMVILRRAKRKKPVNETPMEQSDIPKVGTEKMPSFSERTTLYEPEATHKTEVKLSSQDTKTAMPASDDFVLRLKRSESQSNSSSSSPNVAELSTNSEFIADTTTSPENMLKEKIRSQRQEIWTGASSQKKRRPKLKKQKGKKAEENLGLISAQNSQETKKGLTLGIVIIGIAAVVVAVVLGVLLGYLLA